MNSGVGGGGFAAVPVVVGNKGVRDDGGGWKCGDAVFVVRTVESAGVETVPVAWLFLPFVGRAGSSKLGERLHTGHRRC